MLLHNVTVFKVFITALWSVVKYLLQAFLSCDNPVMNLQLVQAFVNSKIKKR